MAEIKKLEKEVISNSYLLDNELHKHIKTHKDEYIVFNNYEYVFTDTFEDGVDAGIKKFGENTGFVVSKVSNQPAIFSALVQVK